ncbi:MAG: hypothetical protein E4G74_00550 [Erysipelotrichales bacterium]|nr:MAG: hypothetical protein E4G74_00550 [Erysipelotrichales bacterium]
MKSIVLSAAFSILTIGIGLGMIYFILFDHVNAQTRSLLKRGLQETILQVSELPVDQRRDRTMEIFADFIKPDLMEGYVARVDLMDIQPDPLAIRIRLTISGGSPLFPITVQTEETIVEVIY